MYWNIFSDSEKVNCILADEAFVQEYCAAGGYTYALAEHQPEESEPIAAETPPSAEEQLRADVDYIAAMTGVEL